MGEDGVSGMGEGERGLDRHALYERCVQAPGMTVKVLRAIHGGGPRVLREDFCGTAAVSRAWAARGSEFRAVGVDHDPGVLERGAEELGRAGVADRVQLICADVMREGLEARPADVLFVGNFSIGEIQERRELVRYLKMSFDRLAPGGVFVCDTYGGETAFSIGTMERRIVGEEGERIVYVWEQREADALTARVVNALHFTVLHGDEVVAQLRDAFVYRWRLWSVPELRDAMRETGFDAVEAYQSLPEAEDSEGEAYVSPVGSSDELDASFFVCVAARKGG